MVIINVIKIERFSTSNGDGLRNVVWVSGCPFKCDGCHNPETWDKDKGHKSSDDDYDELTKDFKMNIDILDGITLLGGEPLASWNVRGLEEWCERFKRDYPDKSIWCWTGNLYEDVKDLKIMDYIDVLVDGPFIKKLKDARLVYCGSTNQRVIDVKKSKKINKIISYK